jgi:hypothetical protein
MTMGEYWAAAGAAATVANPQAIKTFRMRMMR